MRRKARRDGGEAEAHAAASGLGRIGKEEKAKEQPSSLAGDPVEAAERAKNMMAARPGRASAAHVSDDPGTHQTTQQFALSRPDDGV